MRSTRAAYSVACLSALAGLSLALQACSNTYSQEASGPYFFNLSVPAGTQSSPLPTTPGLYQVDSFSYYCNGNPNVAVLEVTAGPDAKMTVGLPAAGNVQGGGPKFWLQAQDQVQLSDPNCQLHLFGQVRHGGESAIDDANAVIERKLWIAEKLTLTKGSNGSGLDDQAAGSERIGNPQLIINDLPVL